MVWLGESLTIVRKRTHGCCFPRSLLLIAAYVRSSSVANWHLPLGASSLLTFSVGLTFETSLFSLPLVPYPFRTSLPASSLQASVQFQLLWWMTSPELLTTESHVCQINIAYILSDHCKHTLRIWLNLTDWFCRTWWRAETTSVYLQWTLAPPLCTLRFATKGLNILWDRCFIYYYIFGTRYKS